MSSPRGSSLEGWYPACDSEARPQTDLPVAGALIVAWLGTFEHMSRTLLQLQVAFGGLIAAFALLPINGFSYVLLFLIGATADDLLADHARA